MMVPDQFEQWIAIRYDSSNRPTLSTLVMFSARSDLDEWLTEQPFSEFIRVFQAVGTG